LATKRQKVYNMKKEKRNKGYVAIPEEELKKLYYEDMLSLQQIADKYYVSHPTILNRLKDYGMKKREQRTSWKRRSLDYL